MSKKATYEKSGVNINVADATKKEMAAHLETNDGRVLNKIGAFASLFEAKFPGVKNPVLVLKAEEPGSKQLLAVKYGKIKNIAYDLINHLVNDVIVMGATPLAALDTIICGKLEKPVIVELVRSMAQACREQSCALVGGETSEQPGVLRQGNYVLCASLIGVVDKKKIVDGSRIKKGDYILGLASNGLHTNGYSLVRNLIESEPDILAGKISGVPFIDAVLEPHLCYYNCLKDLFPMPELRGMAHITGGGIGGNLNRILPNDLSANVRLDKMRPLPIFKYIRDAGGVSDDEMLRTFNMGTGMTIVVQKEAVKSIQDHIKKHGVKSAIIGKITPGDGSVIFSGSLKYPD